MQSSIDLSNLSQVASLFQVPTSIALAATQANIPSKLSLLKQQVERLVAQRWLSKTHSDRYQCTTHGRNQVIAFEHAQDKILQDNWTRQIREENKIYNSFDFISYVYEHEHQLPLRFQEYAWNEIGIYMSRVQHLDKLLVFISIQHEKNATTVEECDAVTWLVELVSSESCTYLSTFDGNWQHARQVSTKNYVIFYHLPGEYQQRMESHLLYDTGCIDQDASWIQHNNKHHADSIKFIKQIGVLCRNTLRMHVLDLSDVIPDAQWWCTNTAYQSHDAFSFTYSLTTVSNDKKRPWNSRSINFTTCRSSSVADLLAHGVSAMHTQSTTTLDEDNVFDDNLHLKMTHCNKNLKLLPCTDTYERYGGLGLYTTISHVLGIPSGELYTFPIAQTDQIVVSCMYELADNRRYADVSRWIIAIDRARNTIIKQWKLNNGQQLCIRHETLFAYSSSSSSSNNADATTTLGPISIHSLLAHC